MFEGSDDDDDDDDDEGGLNHLRVMVDESAIAQ